MNLVPDDAPDKGDAVEEIRHRTAARHVLYVGDDATDEDVFRDAATDVTVRVGRTGRSAAAYYIPGQRAIDDLLRALLVARARLDGRDARWEGLVRAAGG